MKKILSIDDSARMSRDARGIINSSSSFSVDDEAQNGVIASKRKALKSNHKSRNKIVCIAVSTGGPQSLQSVIPLLPNNIDAPVIIVQHMPEGFTSSFASRLDSISNIDVIEASEGDVVVDGKVYVAKAGAHLNLIKSGEKVRIHYSNEDYREGVRPCANYMFESLIDLDYEEVIAVVMTGMGADGAEGIRELKESGKPVYVITQDMESCVVYGMPKACVNAGLSDESVSLTKIAQQIILRVGVKSDGC